MASDAGARLAIASAAGWRLLFAGLLISLLVQVLEKADRLASALLLGAVAALVLLDLVRIALKRPVVSAPEGKEAAHRARELDRATGLLDAVSVALFVADPNGRISFANRAGRVLAGGENGRLDEVLGGEAAATVLALPPGGRQLVQDPAGRSILAWVGSFAAPGEPNRLLISLQAVAGELDAVQVGAWHAMSRVLAHEMMNSLTPIASLSESLARLAAEDERMADAAATIGRQSRHLMRFVERYRAVVDLPPPRLGAVELQPFLAHLETLVGPQLRERGLRLTVDAVRLGTTLRADADLLGQALINLLRNAADAAVRQVRLSCTRGGGEWRFEVADDGPGIPDERLEEIFVPFFTTKAEGAGIGLTLARQVALAHGGRLGAARNPDGGMIFALSLPA